MKVGFTGTHHGMTDKQKLAFKKQVFDLNPVEFHHGDCIGADEEAHDLVRLVLPGTVIHVHPPVKEDRRAWKNGDKIYPVGPYLERDQNIVNMTHVMIATPRGFIEEIRSGTWATIRRAKKSRRPIFFIWPDGSITRD